MQEALSADGVSREEAIAILNSPFLPKAPEGPTIRPPGSQLDPVEVTYDISYRTWRLMADYTYHEGSCSILARAPSDFDLASVPRILWSVIAPNELSLVAPLFHDLLYEFKGALDEPHGAVTPHRTFTREECDGLFRDIMEREGVSPWRRWAAYFAVRNFGQSYWDGEGR